ncbi:MAG: hypothetical protein JKX87_07675 [Cycloclasticus sp.]|nr:hypothetical protein [Cycloclasticus sp.]
MKEDNAPKLEDMKGRKSIFHYNDDGKLSSISIEESDKPFFSDRMKEVLNMPAFLRHRFDGKNFHESLYEQIRDAQAKEPQKKFDPNDPLLLDIPEFMRRKE